MSRFFPDTASTNSFNELCNIIIVITYILLLLWLLSAASVISRFSDVVHTMWCYDVSSIPIPIDFIFFHFMWDFRGIPGAHVEPHFLM